jgi:hypothetical protein
MCQPLSANIWHDWESGATLNVAQRQPLPRPESMASPREQDNPNDGWDHLWIDLGGEG